METKKPGKRYNKKELEARGWTPEMIRKHLQIHQQNNKNYYRAAEVAACEKDPAIIQQLEKHKERAEERRYLRSVEYNARMEAAVRVRAATEKALKVAEINNAELRTIMDYVHGCLSDKMLKPQPCSRSGDVCTKDDVLRMAADLSKCDFRADLLKRFLRWAWVLGMDEVPQETLDLYIHMIQNMSNRDLDNFKNAAPNVPVADILKFPAARQVYPFDRDLRFCYLTYYVPDTISHELSRLLEVDPKDEFPEARLMSREFIIHVGGTNTGKTYESLQRLQHAKSGVYLAPLRLLALEVQETMLEHGVNCSMLTGEEEDIRPDAKHISSTVEMLDIKRRYDVAVIDECQMITDKSRGYAWTRAILGVLAQEVHLCVAPEGLDILKRLLEETGEPYKVVQHKRKVPLLWQDKKVSLKQAQPGDAFVAFSKRSVLQMAEALRKDGKSASIIYGDLPYATRRQQMQRFLNGETKVVVATDAIGMGLNLPIHRVIFTANSKFDGISNRPLRPAEVRQIAGRAGRFGIYDEGYVATAPYVRDMEMELNTVPQQADFAYHGFTELVLKVNHPLVDVLRVWNQLPIKAPYVRMDISRYIYIITLVEHALPQKFSKEELLKAGNIPFDEKNDALLPLFLSYMMAFSEGAAEVEKPKCDGSRLAQLETYYKKLSLYYSFAKAFHQSYDKEWFMEEKQMVADEINHLLINELSKRGASCRMCGGPLALNSNYGICQKCYAKRIEQQF